MFILFTFLFELYNCFHTTFLNNESFKFVDEVKGDVFRFYFIAFNLTLFPFYYFSSFYLLQAYVKNRVKVTDLHKTYTV